MNYYQTIDKDILILINNFTEEKERRILYKKLDRMLKEINNRKIRIFIDNFYKTIRSYYIKDKKSKISIDIDNIFKYLDIRNYIEILKNSDIKEMYDKLPDHYSETIIYNKNIRKLFKNTFNDLDYKILGYLSEQVRNYFDSYKDDFYIVDDENDFYSYKIHEEYRNKGYKISYEEVINFVKSIFLNKYILRKIENAVDKMLKNGYYPVSIESNISRIIDLVIEHSNHDDYKEDNITYITSYIDALNVLLNVYKNNQISLDYFLLFIHMVSDVYPKDYKEITKIIVDSYRNYRIDIINNIYDSFIEEYNKIGQSLNLRKLIDKVKLTSNNGPAGI